MCRVGAAGLALGAIIAVNVVVYSGIENGCQASPSEVADENIAVALLVVSILVGTPVWAIVALRRRRLGRVSHR